MESVCSAIELRNANHCNTAHCDCCIALPPPPVILSVLRISPNSLSQGQRYSIVSHP